MSRIIKQRMNERKAEAALKAEVEELVSGVDTVIAAKEKAAGRALSQAEKDRVTNDWILAAMHD
jgi:predicted house-cleaning NTP pyrophosphatase (Maf/HAM1 superfamily)